MKFKEMRTPDKVLNVLTWIALLNEIRYVGEQPMTCEW